MIKPEHNNGFLSGQPITKILLALTLNAVRMWAIKKESMWSLEACYILFVYLFYFIVKQKKMHVKSCKRDNKNISSILKL